MAWHSALGLDEPEVQAPTVVERTTQPPSDHGRSASRRRRARRRRQRPADLDGKRLDIQGLRAVAVVAVVVNHLTSHPQGGFFGVDVFFVISGFLITGHLLREDVKSGRISMIDFYKRRVRRLFPTALTVTALTLIAAFVVFNSERFRNTLDDGIWATLFAANWRLISTGTDYFQSSTPVSPLQHYWSLSVEEQFYFVWPVVLTVALLVTRRMFKGSQNAVAAAGASAALALTLSSAVFAWLQRDTNSIVSYFSTFTRGWELGLGAALAVIAPYLYRRINPVAATAVSWTGLVVIVASFFLIGDHLVPMPASILPCLGAALVIIGWSEKGPAVNPVLTNPVSTYVGDISYSVYVVHFPLIILAAAIVPKPSVLLDFTLALLIIGTSVLIFHVLESPVRASNWLRPGRDRAAEKAAARQRKRRKKRKTVKAPGARRWSRAGRPTLFGAGLIVCGLAVYVIGSSADTGPSDRQLILTALGGSAPSDPTATPGLPVAPEGPLVTAVQAQLRTALEASSWPVLSPPLDKPEMPGTHGCPQAFHPAAQCSWGNPSAAHTIYLIGDSTSAAYTDTFIPLVADMPDWKVRSAGGAGCPFGDRPLNTQDDNAFAADCPHRNDQVVAEIQQMRPDILVLTNSRTDAAYKAAMEGELNKVKDYVGKIVILPNAPKGIDPQSCYTKISTPSNCVNQVSPDYISWLVNDVALAKEFGGTFIDPTAWFATAGYCPPFAGTVPMHKDDVHMTPTYAKFIAPLLKESFTAAGIFAPT